MPPTLKTLGLTVRYANYKDYDRMLSVLTPTEGRIDAIARGCRRPKSRLSAAAQPFAMGEFAFNVRGQRYALGQFELQESYYPLREDLTRLSYASYVTAMAAEAIQPRQQAVDEFALTLHALAFLAYSQMPPQDVAIILSLIHIFALLVIVMVLLMMQYLRAFETKVLTSIPKLIMTGLTLVFTLLISLLISTINPRLAPISTCALLLTLLVGPRMALVINFFASIMAAMIEVYKRQDI